MGTGPAERDGRYPVHDALSDGKFSDCGVDVETAEMVIAGVGSEEFASSGIDETVAVDGWVRAGGRAPLTGVAAAKKVGSWTPEEKT